MLLLYADDVLIASNSKRLGDKIVAAITKKFRVSSEGPIETYLGIDIRINKAEQKVYLSMDRYIQKVLKRFKMLPKPNVQAPLQENLQVTIVQSPNTDEVFRV